MAGEFDGYTLDKRWIRKDGQIIDSIMAANCLRRADGSVDYFVGLVQDITERKRDEERLRESEKRFRVLVESIPHHVWSFRSDGTLGYWNQRLADYTGLTARAIEAGRMGGPPSGRRGGRPGGVAQGDGRMGHPTRWNSASAGATAAIGVLSAAQTRFPTRMAAWLNGSARTRTSKSAGRPRKNCIMRSRNSRTLRA